MSKKKSEKRLTIDKALGDMGIKPVPPDHPIYRMGPTIRFIPSIRKKKENDNEQ